MSDWKKEHPTEPGWYWFYGVTNARLRLDDRPRLCSVKVSRGGRGKGRFLMWVANGGFIYPDSPTGVLHGLWQSISTPSLPVSTCEGLGRCHGEQEWCDRCGCVRDPEQRRLKKTDQDKVCHLISDCEHHPRR